MKTTLLTTLAAALLVFSFGCGGDDDDDNNNCSGDIVATWKVNGTAQESREMTVLNSTSFFNLRFVGCTSGNTTLLLNYIPYPPVVGTYDIKSGPGVNSTVQGVYTNDSDPQFGTDNNNTGTLTITAVDTTNKKLSGTFQFTAKAENSSATKQFTEGSIVNAKYKN